MNTFGKTNKELKENVDHLVRVLSSTCFSHAEEHLEDHWKTRDQAWIEKERQAEVDRGEEEFLALEMVEPYLLENLNTLMEISYHLEAYFTREGVEFRDKIREIKGIVLGLGPEPWKEEDVFRMMDEVGFPEYRQNLEKNVGLYLDQEKAKFSQILDQMMSVVIKTQCPTPPSSQSTCPLPEKKTSISSVSTDTKRTSA